MADLPKEVIDLGDGRGVIAIPQQLINEFEKASGHLDDLVDWSVQLMSSLKEESANEHEAAAAFVYLLGQLVPIQKVVAAYARTIAVRVYKKEPDDSQR